MEAKLIVCVSVSVTYDKSFCTVGRYKVSVYVVTCCGCVGANCFHDGVLDSLGL